MIQLTRAAVAAVAVACMLSAGAGFAAPGEAPFAPPSPPPPDTPVIDGELSPGEWSAARVEPLAGGVEMLILPTAEALFVAVHGKPLGLASLCLASGNRMRVLHASAALGAAAYRRSPGGTKGSEAPEDWELDTDFVWALRDPPGGGTADPVAMKAYYDSMGWIANASRPGNRVREFRVRWSGEPVALAGAFLDTAASAVAYAPRTHADDCVSVGLLRGDPPSRLRLSPQSWFPVVRK